MSIKKVIFVVTGSALLLLPALTSARSLGITNNTKKPFTVRIAEHCSSAFGVINVNATVTIDDQELYRLCGDNYKTCLAEIYRSTDCTGERIVQFHYDVKEHLLWGSLHVNGPYTAVFGYDIGLSVSE